MSHLDPQFLDKLSEDHKRELDALVAFFRRNVQALKQEITRAIRDESDTLTVSLYTVEEITAKLASLQDSINAQVHSEFEHYLNQFALCLAQLFLQAEGQSVTMHLDPNRLDDAQLLAALREFGVGTSTRALEDLGKRKLNQISPIDANLVAQLKTAEGKAADLEERVKALEAQLADSQRKNQQLEAENAALIRQNQNLHASLKDELVETLQAEINRLKELNASEQKQSAVTISELEQQLKAAKAELEEKVRATTQFQQLQKLMVTKNELINTLREQIKSLQAAAGSSTSR